MAIDKRFAVFAVCERDVNVYSHTVGPFFYINQFNHCTHLIRVPLESFIRLAAQVGDPSPKVKFVLLSNTGRCGSTLLTQLFEQLSNTVAISEPEVLMEFSQNNTFHSFSKARQHLLLQACIRLLFKSASQSKENKDQGEIDSFVIKPKAHGIFVAKSLNLLYPNIKNLYMYRHPVEYVKSVRSVYHSLMHPIVRHIMVYAAFDLNMYEFIMRQFGQQFEDPNNMFSQKLVEAIKELDVDQNEEERFAALYCGNLLSIMSMASSGMNNIGVVSYHELKDDTESDMRRILKHCDMGVTHKGLNEDASFVPHLPENDSQNNSGLSRNKLKSYQAILKTHEILVVDKVLELCGFPPCHKFPTSSAALTDLLNIKKEIKCLDLGEDSSLVGGPLRTSSETCPNARKMGKMSDSQGNNSKYANDIQKSKTTPLVTNKSLWLPVNRFF